MHSCPECGQACYCGGDIDDVDVGDEEAVNSCIHCDDYVEDEGTPDEDLQ